MSAQREYLGTAHLQAVLDNEVNYHLWQFWRSLTQRASDHAFNECPTQADELHRIANVVQAIRMLLKHTRAHPAPVLNALRAILAEFAPDEGVNYEELEIARRAAELAAHEMGMP